MHMETNSDQMVGPEGISGGERGQVYSRHVEQSNPHGLSFDHRNSFSNSTAFILVLS